MTNHKINIKTPNIIDYYINMYKLIRFSNSDSVDFYLGALASQEVKGVGLEGGVPLSLCIYNALFTANQTHPSFLAMCPNA